MNTWLKVFDTKQNCSFYFGNDETKTQDMEQLNSMMTKRFCACYAHSCSVENMTYRILLEHVYFVFVFSVKLQQIIFAKTVQIVCSVDNWCEHWYRYLNKSCFIYSQPKSTINNGLLGGQERLRHLKGRIHELLAYQHDWWYHGRHFIIKNKNTKMLTICSVIFSFFH